MIFLARRSIYLAMALFGVMSATSYAQTKFLYVTNETTSNISVFSVDSTTGQLYADATVATRPMPHWIQFSPSGSFAYVVADDGNAASLTTYAVNAANGNLTQTSSLALTPATFSTLRILPSGAYLILTDGRNDQFSVYRLDQTTGAPTLVSTSSSPNTPWSVAVGPGPYAYVAGNGNNLTMFSLNQTTGSTTAIPPIVLRVTTTPENLHVPTAQLVVLHPNGNVLYAADPVARTLSSFSVSSSGVIIPLGAAVNTGVSGSDIVISPNGEFLYVGDWSKGFIAGFSLNSIGNPTALAGSPFLTPFVTPNSRGAGVSLAIDSFGQFLYATSYDSGQITSFRIDQTSGALSQIAGSLLPTGGSPFRVVAAP